LTTEGAPDSTFGRVPHRAEAAALVSDVLATRWPGRFRQAELEDEVELGENGLALDSIEMAELLIECMDRLRLPIDGVDELLEAGPVSVGRLIDYLAAA
jgi:acyl carrier protein